MTVCADPACDDPGVFPSPNGAPGELLCADHFLNGTGGAAPEPVAQVVELVYHPDLAGRFASMVMEHTAIAMGDDENAVEMAYKSMVENTGFTTDVCAGILLCTSMLRAASQLDADAVMEMAAALEAHADDAEWMDQDPPPAAATVAPVADGLGSEESSGDDEPGHVICPTCDGSGRVDGVDEGAYRPKCNTCDGTGYLPEPTGPTIFDALAGLDDEPLTIPASDPEAGNPNTQQEVAADGSK